MRRKAEAAPVLTPDEARLAALAAIALRERAELAGYAADPWLFFRDRLNLLDPLEPAGRQIAPYPHFEYCKHMINEIHTQNQLCIWKARRMIVSNTVSAYFTERAAHMENQRFHLIARVEGENAGEGARELIARCVWFLENLRPGPRINFIAHKLSIEFPDTGSLLIGMGGNEPHKMRSLASNGVFCDEFVFWDKPEEAYTALRPTVEGRGKVIIASSTGAGFFKEIVYDESDSWMAGNAIIGSKPRTAQNVTQYVDGMEAWNNRGNGFRILALDYWADPRKPKGGAWEQSERKGMTDRAFRQEYGREFNLNRGRPVFLHEFDESRMVVPDPKVEPYEPLIVSLDFGYQRPAMTISWFRNGKAWIVLRALLGHQTHLTPFIQQIQTLMKEWYPDHENWLWCADHAGHQEGRDSPSEIAILKQKFHLNVRSKLVKEVGPTIDLIRDFMCTTVRGPDGPIPAFQIARHSSTRIVIDGARGGYRYPEARPGKPEPEKPHADGFYIHLWDTIRYAGINFGRSRFKTQVDLAVEAARGIVQPRDYTV